MSCDRRGLFVLLTFATAVGGCRPETTLELVNGTNRQVSDLVLIVESGGEVRRTALAPLPPLGSVPVRLPLRGEGGVRVRFVLDGHAFACDEQYVESGYRTRIEVRADGRCSAEIVEAHSD